MESISDLVIDNITRCAVGVDRYAILDFPDHSNVGDSAIYLGERKVLSSIAGCEPAYVSSVLNHNDRVIRDFGDSDIIFLHGGGNFGDVWPLHQKFRERVIETFPSTKIVQLPQSIHFENQEFIQRCARAIDRHKDFTLFVRDKESLEFAEKQFNCQVYICPDSAFAIGRIERPRQPEHNVISLLRTDIEKNSDSIDLYKLQRLGPIDDWVIDFPNTKSFSERILEKISGKHSFLAGITSNPMVDIFDTWAQKRVDRGVDQLCMGNFVITDRLHAHILSSLLEIEHAVLDNSYGKISRYINAWPDLGFGKIASHTDDVLNIYRTYHQNSD